MGREQGFLSLPECLSYLLTAGITANGGEAEMTLEQHQPFAADLLRHVRREMAATTSSPEWPMEAPKPASVFPFGATLQQPFFWDPITRLRLIVQAAKIYHENHGVLTQILRTALAAEEVEAKYSHDWSVRFEPALYVYVDAVRGQQNQGPYRQNLESLLRFIQQGHRQASAALLSSQLRRPGGTGLLLATDEPQLTAPFQPTGAAELWVAKQVQTAAPALLLDLLRAIKTKPLICRYLRRNHDFSHVQRCFEL